MISKLSSKIVRVLISQSVIDKENKELYDYGFFILFSQILYFVISLIVGVILTVIPQSLIFYISFMFIRRYAGGYHASTETRCGISTTISIITCIAVIKFSNIFGFQTFLLIVSAISAVCIFCFCPLDTPEKPLNDKEFRYFRRISWLILLIIIISITISYVFEWNFIFAPCCMSLILESILISTGKIKKMADNKKKKI